MRRRDAPRVRWFAVPRLGLLTMWSFLRSPLTVAALAALVLIPLLYSGMYLWSFWDPFDRAEHLPVALVNEDEPVEAGGEQVDIGGELTEELLDRGDLDWRPVDADEAASGVQEGEYYVSLTIPPHFSEDLTSPSRDHEDPTRSLLVANYNDANGYVVRQITSSAFKEIREAAAQEAISGYFDEIFVGFNDVQGKTEEAAEGAGELSTGAGDAEEGSGELSEGAGEAHEGAGDLDEGLTELLEGSRTLATGTETVSEEIGGQVERLDEFADEWQPRLEEDVPALQERAESVAEVSGELSTALESLPEETETEELADLDRRLSEFLEENPELADEYPEAHGILVDVQDGLGTALSLAGFVEDHRSDIDDAAETAATVSSTASALAEDLPGLVEDAGTARERAEELSEVLDEISTGAGDLREGLDEASSGASDLDEGLGSLSGGAFELHEGLGELAGGADELAEGLDEGAEEVPTYSERGRADAADMMSEPVSLDSEIDNEAPDYGTGFAPFFVPLSLWVGAMMVFMVLPALSSRALSSAAPSWRVALAGRIVPLMLGSGQVLVMMAVLSGGLGLSAPNWPALIGFLLLTSAAFTATVQYLNVKFGSAGRVVALVLLVLQLTSAGGTYPTETSPAFFQEIGPYLPLYWAVTAVRQLLAGGETFLVLQAVGG
ncbi:YhgE/Pip domain-containing protein, partial [Nocardiopsis xinjiangensis]|uniref:YhgE/Pip domain-containing protein n=1 Tax=Nocardiopsis xinjiangensis TaxID=124285 RepID=UPI000524D14A